MCSGKGVFGEPPGQLLWKHLPVGVWAFDLCPPFLKDTCRPSRAVNEGPFPHNNQPLFTPSNGVLGTWRQREVGWEAY